MNKIDLIHALSDMKGLSKIEAAKIVNMFFDQMANTLEKGDRVEIRGLFSFYVRRYKSYSGRNPKSGKTVEVKPKKLPYFKCGKDLKQRVDK